jgi:hypothetical protein
MGSRRCNGEQEQPLSPSFPSLVAPLTLYASTPLFLLPSPVHSPPHSQPCPAVPPLPASLPFPCWRTLLSSVRSSSPSLASPAELTSPSPSEGVIGGSGLYKLDNLKVEKTLNPVTVRTPSPHSRRRATSGRADAVVPLLVLLFLAR